MEDSELDTALKALADRTRRDVLDQLRDTDAYETTETDREKMTALIHNHLPRLAENNYIEYEHTAKGITVRRGDNWETLADLLDKVESTGFLDT